MSDRYVDSDGVAHQAMPFSEALEIVHEMASSNMLDDGQAMGAPELERERSRQEEAVNMLHDLVVNYSDQLDGSFQPPPKASERPADREPLPVDADLTVPSNYLRLCLDLASQAHASDAADRSPGLEDDTLRQSQALDVGWDLLDLHGPELDLSITAVPSPRF
ncbi:hypothetical protein BHAOGJBA_5168 [Methylobacterium hispanicum]|uniref:Uncharacterized protein n=1 Tax=Methylobacterium hispanicum TaxID=270350 RepID=A0AAV4ZVQ8_9HYPH|nr:hypothetical protein [Methylobacterium hispanicum]GJD91620.1 hypothetical protein BHAOGJBA_5168 [Methylobacterium hispanicum]